MSINSTVFRYLTPWPQILPDFYLMLAFMADRLIGHSINWFLLALADLLMPAREEFHVEFLPTGIGWDECLDSFS